MRYLTLEEILVLHEHQISMYGGPNDIRDIRLLESALFRPKTEFYGRELYKDTYDKAVILGTTIIQNHPFIDGNKRTGIHAMLVMLGMNSIEVNIEPEKLTILALQIARKEINTKDVVTLLKEKTI